MKTFNDDPIDIYPTFTLCFQGDKFHWYQHEKVFDSYGVTTSQYELMLKGEDAMKNVMNKTTKLYTKTSVFFNDSLHNRVDEFHVRQSDFIHELKFVTEEGTNDVYFTNNKTSNSTFDEFIKLSYQTADKICFTRPSKDARKSIRLHDLISLNSSTFGHEMFESTELQVFIHSPEQLMPSFDKPNYKESFENLMHKLKPKDSLRILEFHISQIRQIRKRPDSNLKCNSSIHNFDEYYQKQVIDELGCVPPYWNHLFSNRFDLGECTSQKTLKDAHSIISNPKRILGRLDIPCHKMILLKIDSLNKEPSPIPKDVSLDFVYDEKAYEEIRYNKMMGFESWISNVGGFVGIFLGYSMLQIPEIIVCMITFFHHQKFKMIYGNLIIEINEA